MTTEEIIIGLQNANSYAIDQYNSTHSMAYYDIHKLIDCMKHGFMQVHEKNIQSTKPSKNKKIKL